MALSTKVMDDLFFAELMNTTSHNGYPQGLERESGEMEARPQVQPVSSSAPNVKTSKDSLLPTQFAAHGEARRTSVPVEAAKELGIAVWSTATHKVLALNDGFNKFMRIPNTSPVPFTWDQLPTMFGSKVDPNLENALITLRSLTNIVASGSSNFQNAELILPMATGPVHIDAKVMAVPDQILWVFSRSVAKPVTEHQDPSFRKLVLVNPRMRKCKPWASSMSMFTLLSEDELLLPCKRRKSHT